MQCPLSANIFTPSVALCVVSQPSKTTTSQAIDLEALYRTYGPMVLRRCQHLLKNQAQALDAMQDVFVEILRRKDRLDARSPTGLLLTTATHVCLNMIRSSQRRNTHPETDLLSRIADLDGNSNPENTVISRRMLNWVFHPHSQSTRLIAVLHHVDGLTWEEVAKETGLSVSGIRKRLATLQATISYATQSQA